jgi:hypothetical protein
MLLCHAKANGFNPSKRITNESNKREHHDINKLFKLLEERKMMCIGELTNTTVANYLMVVGEKVKKILTAEDEPHAPKPQLQRELDPLSPLVLRGSSIRYKESRLFQASKPLQESGGKHQIRMRYCNMMMMTLQ